MMQTTTEIAAAAFFLLMFLVEIDFMVHSKIANLMRRTCVCGGRSDEELVEKARFNGLKKKEKTISKKRDFSFVFLHHCFIRLQKNVLY